LIKDESIGEAKFWALLVDDFTYYFWNYFVKNVDDLKTKMVKLVEK
jgi:hypothetical protein